MYAWSSSSAVAAGSGQGHMPPGASREWAPKEECGFFATRNIQKLCELCSGRNGHGRTNHVHRTTHIFDVISSFSTAPTFKGRGMEGEVRQNDLCPGGQKPSHRHCSSDPEVGQGTLEHWFAGRPAI